MGRREKWSISYVWAIKKGNPNVIGEGIKAAASGYAESKANREAKKKSENSGKGITIANYGVANIGDVNNKLNHASLRIKSIGNGISVANNEIPKDSIDKDGAIDAMAKAICKSAYANDELSKPAKKDIFDKLADSIMSLFGEEPHEKTQREQLYGAQFLEISIQQQETASEFSQAFETSCRASVSFDRVSEVLSSEAGEANVRTNPTKGVGKGKDIVGSTFNDIKPTQDMVNPEKVAEYANKLKSGQYVEPIEVVEIPEKGKYIVEGHHRYVASQKTGIPVEIKIRQGNGPTGLPDWGEVQWKQYINEDQFWGE